MTNSQFEAFMANLARLSDLDAQAATSIGCLYTRPAQSPDAHNHQRDAETHRYNQEWTDQ